MQFNVNTHELGYEYIDFMMVMTKDGIINFDYHGEDDADLYHFLITYTLERKNGFLHSRICFQEYQKQWIRIITRVTSITY